MLLYSHNNKTVFYCHCFSHQVPVKGIIFPLGLTSEHDGKKVKGKQRPGCGLPLAAIRVFWCLSASFSRQTSHRQDSPSGGESLHHRRMRELRSCGSQLADPSERKKCQLCIIRKFSLQISSTASPGVKKMKKSQEHALGEKIYIRGVEKRQSFLIIYLPNCSDNH